MAADSMGRHGYQQPRQPYQQMPPHPMGYPAQPAGPGAMAPQGMPAGLVPGQPVPAPPAPGSGMNWYPPMPSEPPAPERGSGPKPRLVAVASTLLLVNLGLSVLVTVLSFVYSDDIVALTLGQTRGAGLSDETARQAVESTLLVRAGVNVLVGLMYLFLIAMLHRGKRWAWRRLVWLAIGGCAGMVYLLVQPYPVIFKVEQVMQLLVLAGLAYCLLHPATRAHYAKR